MNRLSAGDRAGGRGGRHESGGARRGGGLAAFTLIELLVVVAIIGILAGILLPVISRGRATGLRTKCMSNLHQLGIATQVYVADHGSYPPAWGGSTCRWMDLLKPYLDKKSYAYRCPCDPVQTPLPWDSQITMSYGMNTFNFGGNAHCFWYGVSMGAVARPSHTILFADCTPGAYWCGGGASHSEPVPKVDYRHAGGTFCAAFCDGHVSVMKETTRMDWDASR